MTPQQIDGYAVVGLLGVGGRGTVYKVIDPLSGQALALKILRLSEVTPLEQQRFELEFKVAASIINPYVVRVFDLGTYEGMPYYTMELVNGSHLRAHMDQLTAGPAQRRWYEQVAQISDQMLQALDAIHAQRIIHRDLKPENILVEPGPRARLVDFGLAKLLQPHNRMTETGEIVGTARFIAPEALMQQEVDIRSDLYSLGAVLYEVITARPLFEGNGTIETIGQILYQDPVPLRHHAPAVPHELEAVIMRLLRKDPYDRYANAREVQYELANAFRVVAISVTLPPPAWSTITPADLFEPKMVGRNHLLARLQESVERVKSGEPRWVILRGESGVGKSRLMGEFVRRALQKGIPALWSRCYPNDTTPFRAVMPWLRRLVPGDASMETTYGFLGESASENPADRFRLFELAARQVRKWLAGSPLMLVVEDLQWADAYSIELLEYLTGHLLQGTPRPEHGILLMGTVRLEEVDRNQLLVKWLLTLAKQPGCIDLHLERLSDSSVKEMLQSMLGVQTLPPGLAALVYRETEGNPFFIGELVKSLLAHGLLEQVEGVWTLHKPDGAEVGSMLPHSVQEAIFERLHRLSPDRLDILSHAAVMGQTFGLEEVAASTGLAPQPLIEAVEDLLRQRLIAEEPGGKQFSFYHHKIQEVLLATKGTDELKSLHFKVASALETTERNHATPSGVYSLAYHFARSGDWARSLPYLLAAADLAMHSFAYLQAAEYYDLILEAGRRGLLAENDLLRIQEDRADALGAGGEHVEAARLFDELLARPHPEEDGDVRQARLQRKLARVYYNAGDYDTALQHLDQGLSDIGVTVPKAGLLSYIRIAENFMRSKSSSLARRDFVADKRRSREILELCDAVTHTVYFMDAGHHFSLLVNAILIYKQVAQQEPDAGNLATSEFLLSSLYCLVNPPRIAGACEALQKALPAIEAMADGPRKAALWRECGYLYYLLGRYEDALPLATRGRDLASVVADVSGLGWACIIESNIRWWQGDLQTSRQLAREAIELARSTQTHSAWVVAQVLLARQLMTLGRTEEPERLLESIRPLAPGGTRRFEDLLSDLAHGMLHRRKLEFGEAVALLKQAMAGFESAHSGTTYVLEAGLELAETWHQQALRNAAEAPRLLEEMDKLLRRLGKLSRDMPVRRGALLRLQAMLAEARGRQAESTGLFEDSHRVLDKNRYDLDLALTQEAWGLALERQEAGRGRPLLQRAAELFKRMGAPERSERWGPWLAGAGGQT